MVKYKVVEKIFGKKLSKLMKTQVFVLKAKIDETDQALDRSTFFHLNNLFDSTYLPKVN